MFIVISLRLVSATSYECIKMYVDELVDARKLNGLVIKRVMNGNLNPTKMGKQEKYVVAVAQVLSNNFQ